MAPGDAVTMSCRRDEGREINSLFIRENPGCSYLDIKFPNPPCIHVGQVAVVLEVLDQGDRTPGNGAMCWAKIIAPEGIGWVPRYMLKEIISCD